MPSPRIERKHFLATGFAAVVALFTGRRSAAGATTVAATAPRPPRLAPAERTVSRTDSLV